VLTLQRDKLQGRSATGPNDVYIVDIFKRQVIDRLKTYPILMNKLVTWISLI